MSEFISFITSEASERCQNEKRKTINGEDILYAMCALGFDNYVDPLTLYLHKYRESTKTDRNIGGTADGSFEESSASSFSECTENVRFGTNFFFANHFVSQFGFVNYKSFYFRSI